MPIFYAAVAKDNRVIVQTGDAQSYRRLVEIVCQRLGSSSKTLKHGDLLVHYLPRATHNRAFVCVASYDVPTRQCFAFLERIRQQYNFVKQSGGAGESDTFDSDLRDLAETYGDPTAFKTQIIQDEIRSIKEVMTENIQTMLDAGEQLDALLAHPENDDVEAIKHHSLKVVQHIWWKNERLWIILGSIALVLLFTFVFMGCGVDFSRCDGSADT